jgi:hypothetical protein
LALSLDYRFDYQGNSHDFNEAIYLYEAAPLLSDFSEIVSPSPWKTYLLKVSIHGDDGPQSL